METVESTIEKSQKEDQIQYDDEEVDDRQPMNKRKILKEYTKIELIKKSLQFRGINWQSKVFNQINSTITNFTSFVIPYINGKIIDSISRDKNAEDLSYYFQIMFLYLISDRMFSLFRNWIYEQISPKQVDPSLILLEKILEKDYEFFDNFKSGELLNRIEDSHEITYSNFIEEFYQIFQTLVKLITSILLSMNFSFSLSVTYFILELIKIGLDYYYRCRTNLNNMEFDHEYSDIQGNTLTELINNIRNIKAFSTEKKEFNKLKKEREYVHPKTKYDFNFFLAQTTQIISDFSKYILLFSAGKKAILGEITYGEFTSFLFYTTEITMNLDFLKHARGKLDMLCSDWQRFFEIYDYQPKVVINKGIKLENIKGEISFSDVTFAYPTKPEVKVLENFSININEGQVIAVVGTSGSGKSTLSSLIQRFYNPGEGKIKIDGVDIEEIDPVSLHRFTGFVSQEPILYSGTIEENISYAVDSYSKEDLDRVAKLANAYDFIHDKSQFPDGYSTIVGERGIKVSGGQKQRIAIARALMKNARILIFDEATSALDAESEHEVQKAIDNIVKSGKITTIIIAHRLSTVKNCDRIYVMSQGKIIEEGGHKELLKKNGAYKQLVQRQLEEISLSRGNSQNL